MSLSEVFSVQDWALLSGALRLKPLASRDVRRSVSVQTLLDDEVCAQLLDQLGPVIGSPKRGITASLLAKRFSFLATGACLYALSACDRGLPLTLDNAVLEYGYDEGRWSSSLPLADHTPQSYAPGQREAWREAIVGDLFAGLLAPLWQTFNRVSGISRRILWENTAVRVYSLYEKRMGLIDDPLIRQRCAEDFHWLLEEAAPAVFGLGYNPLGHFRRPLTVVEGGKAVRFRRTCCFWYEVCEPVEFCSGCPLVRPKVLRTSATHSPGGE